MINAVTQALEKSYYHLVVSQHVVDGDIREPIEHIVENKLADGVIFSRVQPLDPRVHYLLERDVPFVCHGRTNFGIPHPYVDFDNEAFIEIALKKLHDDGARKVCVIAPPESLTFHQHVKTGMIKTANQLGIEHMFAQGVTLDSSLEEIAEWAKKMATSPDRPDGFVFLGEASYFATLNAFRESGLERGRDFNVVVKHHSDLITHIDPSVTVVFEDIVKAGRKMGQLLLAQVNATSEIETQYIDQPATVVGC
jgi:LacI family transcriptional regulator